MSVILALMMFQPRKTFVHLENTNKDISDEIWELSHSFIDCSLISSAGPEKLVKPLLK